MEDILKNKTAVVYGAGSIGGAVAAAFAKAGATVFVAAHNEDALKKLADKNIQTERLDVLDKDAVAAFVKSVVEKTGSPPHLVQAELWRTPPFSALQRACLMNISGTTFVLDKEKPFGRMSR